MEPVAKELPKVELPERIRRELRKGETIYHSAIACYVSARYPTGKWVGQVRREDRGRLTKYPVKAFATPQDALVYVKSLRPDAKGSVGTPRQGEGSVADLYAFARKHKWKRLSPARKALKESRWRLHLEPYWATWSLSQVTRRAAQEWVTEVEESIASGTREDKLGIAQFNECRIDMHGLFDALGDFDERFEDKKNPFAGLEYVARPARAKVTVESKHFSPTLTAAFRLAEEGHVCRWIVEMFATSLLAGLREGEVLALKRDRIDFEAKLIKVDRALRRNAQNIDEDTGLASGPIVRTAVNLPKGDKVRFVPMSDQLAKILKRALAASADSKSDFVWPSLMGGMRELTRVQLAFGTLRSRLDDVAKQTQGRFKKLNELVRELHSLGLPNYWQRTDFRDTRNSFASYANEVGVPQATRELILGHGPRGVTNAVYTDITEGALKDAQVRLSNGWTWS